MLLIYLAYFSLNTRKIYKNINLVYFIKKDASIAIVKYTRTINKKL
jgi:hypothetical protein